MHQQCNHYILLGPMFWWSVPLNGWAPLWMLDAFNLSRRKILFRSIQFLISFLNPLYFLPNCQILHQQVDAQDP